MWECSRWVKNFLRRKGRKWRAAWWPEATRLFSDLWFHDIPNTVRTAAQQAGMLGVSLLTVHASGGRKMMAAAVEGIGAAARANGLGAACTGCWR